MPGRRRGLLPAALVLFFLSGVAGLVYESIWSHYLKLFLGHAAGAQTVVLAGFMGGMAIGSALSGRLSARFRNPLRAWALVEALLGVAALAFHGSFTRFVDLAFGAILPRLDSPLAVAIFEQAAALLFLLPATILLGTTFPLLAAGLLRLDPDRPAGLMANLYFVNSLGASAGALASGFVLVDRLGLPGTIAAAGALNLLIALVAWVGSAGLAAPPVERREEASAVVGAGSDRHLVRLLVLAAAVTGFTSFFYEIAWIRGLALVLGSATHSFELMLAVFVLGLALGGFALGRRAARIVDPVRAAGWVQLAMGAAALLSLFTFGRSFALLEGAMKALARNDGGYALFLVAGGLISALVMLPATFFAGMTLPLIVDALVRRGEGERSIGRVWAANTAGSIAGIVLAVHVGLPRLGLAGTLEAGAAGDLLLGLVLLGAALPAAERRRRLAIAGSLSAVALAVTILLGAPDPRQLAAGVFRTGRAGLDRATEILFHRDGKTASVDVTRSADGLVSIRVNGKIDAALVPSGVGTASADESTMVLLGAMPLALAPRARTAAVIGFGSGLTTHVLLAAPGLERVDTVEIEPAVLEGATRFRPRVDRAFTDPRSHLHVGDAKTFFATRRERWDLIVSEPSNPWISGVATLFSEEFYARLRRSLASGGVLVQWVHLYENETRLLASIVGAMDPQFPDWAIYATCDSDALIVARADGALPPIDPTLFSWPAMRAELDRIGVRTPADLALLRFGGRRLLAPWFAGFDSPPNSDYFPWLDRNAPRARFRGAAAWQLTALAGSPLPIGEMLGDAPPADGPTSVSPTLRLARAKHRRGSLALVRSLTGGALDEEGIREAGEEGLLRVRLARADLAAGERGAGAVDNFLRLGRRLVADLSPAELDRAWQALGVEGWAKGLSGPDADAVPLVLAVGRRDAGEMSRLGRRVLAAGPDRFDPPMLEFALGAALLGDLARGETRSAAELWSASEPGRETAPPVDPSIASGGPLPGSTPSWLRLLGAATRR